MALDPRPPEKFHVWCVKSFYFSPTRGNIGPSVYLSHQPSYPAESGSRKSSSRLDSDRIFQFPSRELFFLRFFSHRIRLEYSHNFLRIINLGINFRMNTNDFFRMFDQFQIPDILFLFLFWFYETFAWSGVSRIQVNILVRDILCNSRRLRIR